MTLSANITMILAFVISCTFLFTGGLTVFFVKSRLEAENVVTLERMSLDLTARSDAAARKICSDGERRIQSLSKELETLAAEKQHWDRASLVGASNRSKAVEVRVSALAEESEDLAQLMEIVEAKLSAAGCPDKRGCKVVKREGVDCTNELRKTLAESLKHNMCEQKALLHLEGQLISEGKNVGRIHQLRKLGLSKAYMSILAQLDALDKQ